MAFYESIYILRPDLAAEQVEQINKRVGDIVTNNGGVILKTELWGRRQLAYPIKKNTKGFYVFHVLEGGGQLVAELESRLKIDEDVMKFQNVRVHEASMAATPLAAIGSEEPRREVRDGSTSEDAPLDHELVMDHELHGDDDDMDVHGGDLQGAER
ncbi:MAG: 30S ribosomal protein S6 [Magnetococcales bacterium]|nr:30S ribosomal protein S6 [Magnetococcales bacterium]